MAETPAAELSQVATTPPRGPMLQDITLTVQPGKIVALLGGPGAGKTALLRLLAGFALPAAGRALLGGRDSADLPPHARGVALVEHGLGLFERLSVGRQVSLAAGGDGPGSLLQAAGLAGVAGRLPAALDAGQLVMLAVARALASRPRVLLLDAPEAGLADAVREQLFALLRGARAAGVAVLHATAEAQAALSLADRIAVLAEGTIRQEGTPQAIYDDPADAAVAALTGPVNALPGRVEGAGDEGVRVRLEGGGHVQARGALAPGRACLVCLRPERVAVATAAAEQLGESALAARVDWITYHGDHTRLGLRAGDVALVAHRPAAAAPLRGLAVGRTVAIAWQPHHATAFAAFPGA